MYIAMNRFKIILGREQEFIDIWKNRDSHLAGVAGFKAFHLLQGASDEALGYTLMSSHVMWEDESSFVAWTQSEAFKAAHAKAGGSRDIYLGAAQFEGFQVVVS